VVMANIELHRIRFCVANPAAAGLDWPMSFIESHPVLRPTAATLRALACVGAAGD